MQYALAIIGAAVFVGILLLLPETMHPHTRGVDKAPDGNGLQAHGSRPRLILLNPFASLALLRSPNLLLVVSNYIHQHFIGGDAEDVSVLCRCGYTGHGLR
jgi:hypothetical protein